MKPPFIFVTSGLFIDDAAVNGPWRGVMDDCSKLCWLNGMPKGEHYPGCPANLQARMAAMLRDLEWAGNQAVATCPVCERLKASGHTPDCPLAALLAELP